LYFVVVLTEREFKDDQLVSDFTPPKQIKWSTTTNKNVRELNLELFFFPLVQSWGFIE
jgi:hypothetical protein